MPEMTLAEQRLYAWQNFTCDKADGGCGQTLNHRCRTSSGALTTPHKPRMDQVKYWFRRQPEIDALNAQITDLTNDRDALKGQITGLTTQMGSLKASNDQLDTALTTADHQVDADAKRITSLTADLNAAQQALDDYKATHPDVPPTPPAPELVTFSDFTDQKAGVRYTSDYIGKGIDQTVLSMVPHTSTVKTIVNALDPAKHETNPYRLMRFSGKHLSGFTLRGTDQSHVYGGIQITTTTTGLEVDHLKVQDIAGFAPGPPGETFMLETLRSTGANIHDVTLDGGHNSGTNYGANYQDSGTVANLSAKDCGYGFAVALYQCTGVWSFTDCDFSGGRKAINIERCWADSMDFTRVDLRGLSFTGWHAQISGGDLKKSTKITFTDCETDGPLIVRTYGTAANAGTNGQKDSDIRCIIDGKDVTNDPSKFRIVHAG